MSLLARRLAVLLAAPFRCAPPLRRSEMIEPLEGRRLLSSTTVLLQFPSEETKNTTRTWTASTSVGHTHESVDWEGAAWPGYASGTDLGVTKVDYSLNGEVYYHKSWNWEQNYPGGSYFPRVQSEWWTDAYNPNNNAATVPDSDAQVEFSVTSSGFHANGATVNFSQIVMQVITPDVSVSSSTGSGGDPTASEGDPVDTGRFVFTRFGAPLDVPLTVNYEMSGTATPQYLFGSSASAVNSGYGGEISPVLPPDPDYDGPLQTGTVVFDVGSLYGHLAGEAGNGVVLTPINSNEPEDTETAIATVVAGANYFPAGNPATVLIAQAGGLVTNFKSITIDVTGGETKKGVNVRTTTGFDSPGVKITSITGPGGANRMNFSPSGSFKDYRERSSN